MGRPDNTGVMYVRADYGCERHLSRYYTIKPEAFMESSATWDDELNGGVCDERRELLLFYKGVKEEIYRIIDPLYKECLQIFFDNNHDSEGSEYREKKHVEIMRFRREHGFNSMSKVYGIRTEALDDVYEILLGYGLYMGEFCRFDVHSFLKNAHKWADKLDSARERADYQIGMKAMAADGVGGGKKTYHIGDPVLDDVLALEEIKGEIRRYETYIEVLKDAINHLRFNIQKELIYRLFLPRGKDKYRTKNLRKEKIADKYNLSVTSVERQLREAKDDIQAHIERKYFGKR